MRKKVYIAGPLTKGVLADNVNQATEAFVQLAKLGFAPFCPHLTVYLSQCVPSWESELKQKPQHPFQFTNYNMYSDRCVCEGTVTGHPDLSHEDFIDVDLPWVVASDAVLRLPGESKGADAEVNCALDHSVPVFYSIDELVGYFKEAT